MSKNSPNDEKVRFGGLKKINLDEHDFAGITAYGDLPLEFNELDDDTIYIATT